MKVLLVSATPFEIQPVHDFLRQEFVGHRPYQYQKGDLGVHVLITGVGLPLTAFALGKVLGHHTYDLAINAGIAGSFRRDRPLGQVVQVVSEHFADLGVEEADGAFTSAFDLELIGKDDPPFRNAQLLNEDSAAFDFLPRARGISVNRVHGSEDSIRKIRTTHPEIDVESMEGAAFFYACLMEELPFLEIRAISNYVEARNRESWEVGLAIRNLNDTLIQLLKSLASAG